MVETYIAGLLGAGFLAAIVIGLAELFGKLYSTFDSLLRKELTMVQKIIYLILIWAVPLGWAIYLILGRERTARLFSNFRLS